MSIERFNDNIRHAFGDLEHRINGAAGGPLHAARKAALEAFGTQGVPTMRHEEWKYTNVLPLLGADYRPASGINTDGLDIEAIGVIPEADAYRLIIVNGTFLPQASTLPQTEAVVVERITDELLQRDADVAAVFGTVTPASSHPFVAVNTALAQDGVLVRVHGQVTRPLQIVCIADARTADVLHTPRVLVIADAHATATIIESHHTVGDHQGLGVGVVEIVGAPNSHVRCIKVLHDGPNGSHIGATSARCDRDAKASCATVITGGRFSRNDLSIQLTGSGAEGYLYGVSVLDGTQFADNHTVVDHIAPHCHSEELYKGVYDGKSTGVFNGKIFVRPDAQKTTAYQSNHTLLLSDAAQVNAKPQLEIWADDVKCSHGATTGHLNEEALFYLQSRGIPQDDARRLLTHAFANDVLDHLDDDAVRTYLVGLIDEALA